MKKIIEAQIPEEKLNRLATVFIQAANEFTSYIVISRGGMVLFSAVFVAAAPLALLAAGAAVFLKRRRA